jgi:hypothetical protein
VGHLRSNKNASSESNRRVHASLHLPGCIPSQPNQWRYCSCYFSALTESYLSYIDCCTNISFANSFSNTSSCNSPEGTYLTANIIPSTPKVCLCPKFNQVFLLRLKPAPNAGVFVFHYAFYPNTNFQGVSLASSILLRASVEFLSQPTGFRFSRWPITVHCCCSPAPEIRSLHSTNNGELSLQRKPAFNY